MNKGFFILLCSALWVGHSHSCGAAAPLSVTPSTMSSHSNNQLMDNGKKLKRIFFNLYTDSIKPVLNFYVNVDGEFMDGTYWPMDANTVIITANRGTMKGMEWIAPKHIDFSSVTFTVVAKSDTTLSQTITVPMKQNWQEDDGVLEMKDVMPQGSKGKQ